MDVPYNRPPVFIEQEDPEKVVNDLFGDIPAESRPQFSFIKKIRGLDDEVPANEDIE